MNIIEELFHGSTIKHLSKNDLENIEIPLPSIEIQQQINNQLDILYQQIDIFKQSINNYEILKKATLNNKTIHCQKMKLGDIFKTIKTGKNKTNDNKTGTLYPYYGTGGITGYTDDYIIDGEYILTARNGTIGQSFYINGKSYPSDHMFILSDTEQNIKYIYYTILYICNLEQYANGTTIKGISKENLINIEIPIPTVEIQQQIIKQLENYDKHITLLTNDIKQFELNNIIDDVLSQISTTTIETNNENIIDVETTIIKTKTISKPN